MKKLVALSLVWLALAFGGCQNETTPSSPGGSPSEPQRGQAPDEP